MGMFTTCDSNKLPSYHAISSCTNNYGNKQPIMLKTMYEYFFNCRWYSKYVSNIEISYKIKTGFRHCVTILCQSHPICSVKIKLLFYCHQSLHLWLHQSMQTATHFFVSYFRYLLNESVMSSVCNTHTIWECLLHVTQQKWQRQIVDYTYLHYNNSRTRLMRDSVKNKSST